MPTLVYKQLDGTEKRLEFGSKPLIIGRLPESELQVREAFISRVHAGISYANEAFVLKDLGSTNGTYRNGARVYECNLATGDRIQVGNASLLFEIDTAAGTGILRQVPAATAPRQIITPAPQSGVPPTSELKTTIPVKIPPPPVAKL
ncbi:MAG: FHA domain-containing protein [Verrucomicrobiota bacterium]